MQMTVSVSRPSFARGRSSRAARSGARRWRIVSVGCLLMAVLVYGAAPIAMLWHAADGMRSGDTDALRLALDWRSVRAGLKQDLGDGAALAPSLAATAPMDELPAFGESFVTNVVSHAVDDEVTPERLVAMVSGPSASTPQGWRQMLGRIVSLRFSSPTRFEAAIRMKDDASPLLVSLQLRQWQWRVTRIHLPDDGTTSTARTDRT